MKRILMALALFALLAGGVGCTGMQKSIEVGNPQEEETPMPVLEVENEYYGVTVKVREDFQFSAQSDSAWVLEKFPSTVKLDFSWDDGNCPPLESTHEEDGFVIVEKRESVLSTKEDRGVCIETYGRIMNNEIIPGGSDPVDTDPNDMVIANDGVDPNKLNDPNKDPLGNLSGGGGGSGGGEKEIYDGEEDPEIVVRSNTGGGGGSPVAPHDYDMHTNTPPGEIQTQPGEGYIHDGDAMERADDSPYQRQQGDYRWRTPSRGTIQIPGDDDDDDD